MGDQSSSQLAQVIQRARDRIAKHRGDKNFNEQNTKASLIVPVLQALGWDTNDSDEVHWEYKPKPKYNPVDFALLLQRTPCLLLEAKALRESLADDKLVAQILTYASVAGVQWVVLSNGDEYRIFNAAAPLPVEEKLFRKVSISSDDPTTTVATLALLSKQDLQDKKIGRLWESHFVDQQVKNAIEEILNPVEPAKVIVRAIKTATQGRLRESDVRASVRRLHLQLDFPQPDIAEPPDRRKGRGGTVKGRRTGPESAGPRNDVTLQKLIEAGVLTAPARLECRYRGHDLTAVVEKDGAVSFGGARYDSPSTAGGMARKPYHRGDLKGRSYPQTNGWIFWQVRDPASGEMVPLDALRARYLERKKSEAERFQKGSG